MPTITIDGKACSFDGKKMILQVALEHGIELPHYCYHPGLSIVASCRICLAEVEQKNPKSGALELIPKLMPTCQTPAADGMVVHTQSPKSVANQKAVMEYLLINHPLDCPVCDQAGECHLQDYSYKYGRAESRFQEDKIKQPKKDIGPHVLLYSDRCIMCSRCVRFTREVSGTAELMISGRGNREQIDVFPGKALDNELSGNVVDICPVGALLDKDFLFTQRVWFLQETPSIDGITAGGDNLWVHHNEGRLYRIKPRSNPQVNQWWISDEVRYGWKFVHAQERLTQPRRTQVGTQVDCDVRRAAVDAAEGLKRIVREKGPGSLALLVSPMLPCEDAWLLAGLALGLDPEAVLGIGPVPIDPAGDKAFPGGYTVSGEKCPNSRGVKRAIAHALGSTDRAPLDFADWCAKVGEKTSKTSAVLLTGNYPSKWTTKELTTAVAKKFLVLMDTLPNDLSARADVLIPAATWVEKSGTFENKNNRMQSFRRAIPPIEGATPEGQTALDLMAILGLAAAERYDDHAVRARMGGAFVTEVHHPHEVEHHRLDMQYVEF